MNFIGKIFTVIIFLLCVVYSAMTLMVFSTHSNWKLKYTAQATEDKKLNSEIDKLKLDMKAMEDRSKAEHDEQEKRLAGLQTKVGELSTQVEGQEKKLVEKDENIRSLAAAVDGAHATLASLREQSEKMREETRIARNERDERYKSLVARTDELHNVISERDGLKGQNSKLAAEVAQLIQACVYFKIDYKGDYRAKEPPYGTEGEVVAAPRPDIIEISLGSDDGLRIGHKLEVVRPSTRSYIGRIEVVKLTPNRAVCRPDQSMQRSAIQKGDRIYGNLNQIK